MYKNLSTFSLNCKKLLFFLKLCGLMHVDLENRRDHVSPAAITYTIYLIAFTILTTIFAFLNIEVDFFNVKNKDAEGKFVIAFFTIIVFLVVNTVFVVASMSFSLKSSSQKLFHEVYDSLDIIHNRLLQFKRFQFNTKHLFKFWPVLLIFGIRFTCDCFTFAADPKDAFVKNKMLLFFFEYGTFFTCIVLILNDMFLIALLDIVRNYFHVMADVVMDVGILQSENRRDFASPVFYMEELDPDIPYKLTHSSGIWTTFIQPRHKPARNAVSILSDVLRLYYHCQVTCRRINSIFNMFMFSAVSVSFVGFTTGCFFISQLTIFILEGFVNWSEVGPAIVLAITNNFTLMFFLFRMVQCCYNTKQDGERVLSCVRQMFVSRKDVRASNKIRHLLEMISQKPLDFTAANFFSIDYGMLIHFLRTVITYWIILIQLQIMIIKR